MSTEGTLWMGDLEPWICESFIIDSFKKFGFQPLYVKIIKDKRINKFRNFCFVTFKDLEEANAALFTLNAKKIPKTNIFFKLNLTKNNPKINKNLYVGNLPRNINDIGLFNFFKSKYPSVYFASIIADNGLSRGYGFVHFSDEKEYQKCLKEMDGITLGNKTISVKEKKVDPSSKNNTINLLLYIKNFKNLFYQPKITEKENTLTNNYLAPNTKENKNLFLPKKHFQNSTFSENIELLRRNDNKLLDAKIQESIDKIFDNQFKKIKNFDQMPKMVSYYCSYSKQINKI